MFIFSYAIYILIPTHDSSIQIKFVIPLWLNILRPPPSPITTSSYYTEEKNTKTSMILTLPFIEQKNILTEIELAGSTHALSQGDWLYEASLPPPVSRFDITIAGKREMLVQYNPNGPPLKTYRFTEWILLNCLELWQQY